MERLHIAVFGPVNSGKSTLVNAICGQEVSLVSEVPGTTTDPVRKAAELPGLGPCIIIDTAGLGDEGVLGGERERRTLAVLDETDAAIVIEPSRDLLESLGKALVPYVIYSRGESIHSLLQRLAEVAPKEEERFLTGGLVDNGSVVLLVMPQDGEAPKGRLILPQVQVLRELLDRGCTAICCTPGGLAGALGSLAAAPDLVITDSQVFGEVERAIPPSCPLTSFSVLLAAAKGDVDVFLEGARAIDNLGPGSRVLIAEACTHVPQNEDIGRVKIPSLLRRKAGPLRVDIAAGNDFPDQLAGYDLIIHCGACVASSRLLRSRIRRARQQGVPITNYGIALAALKGILSRIALP